MKRYYLSTELYHHGILGQKWGIRRYQNKDGTRTEEGKARYSSNVDLNDVYKVTESTNKLINTTDTYYKNRELKRVQRENEALTKEYKTRKSNLSKGVKEDLSQLSDEDLQKRIDRLNLELKYKDLRTNLEKPEQDAIVSKGENKVSDILEIAGDLTTVAGSAVSLLIAIQALKKVG